MVSIPVCYTGDRGSIPRQRELLQPNTRFHQITVSIFDVSKFNPGENVADDCKENQGEIDIQLNISVRKVVKTPVCHVVDRGSIPRQRELLEINTSFHKTTDSTFGVHIFRKIKTREKTERKSKRNEQQINISVSTMVLVRVCLAGDRGSIPRQRELLEPNTRPHQITFSTFDVSKFKPEKTCRMIEKKTKVDMIISPTCLLV